MGIAATDSHRVEMFLALPNFHRDLSHDKSTHLLSDSMRLIVSGQLTSELSVVVKYPDSANTLIVFSLSQNSLPGDKPSFITEANVVLNI